MYNSCFLVCLRSSPLMPCFWLRSNQEVMPITRWCPQVHCSTSPTRPLSPWGDPSLSPFPVPRTLKRRGTLGGKGKSKTTELDLLVLLRHGITLLPTEGGELSVASLCLAKFLWIEIQLSEDHWPKIRSEMKMKAAPMWEWLFMA